MSVYAANVRAHQLERSHQRVALRILRAALMLLLEHSVLRHLLCDQDAKGNDNDDDLFYCAIPSHRYLACPEVVKTGSWSPERIFMLGPSAAGMNQSQQTFGFLVKPAAFSE
ncbi:unnamed protein product [Phytophthora fragariaefolia]|uniref:Unnamed protein product n=1 Tax=Phytophthora fragariaefolia TaxID=1490495 RepID=A0A9W6Y592_9STRA|nr:unnamed protein product [Phytophthora fragariaefolia]